MSKTHHILVTGEHAEGHDFYPALDQAGQPILWRELPVLKFERLKVDGEKIKALLEKPVSWIIFPSARAVAFWTETLLEHGLDFPLETQVACIGERTASIAAQDGFNADFYPTEPGTEKFLEEFEHMVMTNSEKPSVLIPMAEGGRKTIAEHLAKLGCEVHTLPLYRTDAREDIGVLIDQKEVDGMSMVLFTSPTSVDAFLSCRNVPKHVRVGSIGRFTADHLVEKGFSDVHILPEGDFQKIGELLC